MNVEEAEIYLAEKLMADASKKSGGFFPGVGVGLLLSMVLIIIVAAFLRGPSPSVGPVIAALCNELGYKETTEKGCRETVTSDTTLRQALTGLVDVRIAAQSERDREFAEHAIRRFVCAENFKHPSCPTYVGILDTIMTWPSDTPSSGRKK